MSRHDGAVDTDRSGHKRGRSNIGDPLAGRPRRTTSSVTGYRLYRGARRSGRRLARRSRTRAFCGTSYALGVAAVDGAGNVSGSATTKSATTPCPDTTAPSTPTGLAASAVGQTSATLSWTASIGQRRRDRLPDIPCGTQVGTTASTSSPDRHALRDHVHARRRGCRCCRQRLGTATTNVTTTAVSGHVAAVDADRSRDERGRADLGDIVVVGVVGQRRRGRVPAVPRRVAGRDGVGTTFTYSRAHVWDVLRPGCGSDRRGGQRVGTATTGVTSAACPDTDGAVDTDGLATSAVGQSSATLSWTASSDNVAVTGYRVFRDGTQVGTTAVDELHGTGLTCATTYTLGVAALDAAGNVSGNRDEGVTTTACPDTTPPSIPTGLATSAVGQTSTTLSWTASSDNVAVTGYRVFRDGTQVGTAASTTFDYTRLSCGTTLHARCRRGRCRRKCLGTATKALTTAVCSDTTPPSTPTGLATSGVGQTSAGTVLERLDRQRRCDRLSGVPGRHSDRHVARDSAKPRRADLRDDLHARRRGGRWRQATSPGPPRGASPRLPARIPTPPSTPTGLATSAVSQTSATLSWAASTDNVGVTGLPGLPRRLAGRDSDDDELTLSRGLTCGTTYTLGVAAVDAAGNVSAPRRTA